MGAVRHCDEVLAVCGERLALTRLAVGTTDVSQGAPRDELLQLYGIHEDGLIALQILFDVDDMDAALAELDAAYARFDGQRPQARRPENTAARIFDRLWSHFADRDWDAVAETVAASFSGMDHRRVVNGGIQHGRDAVIQTLQASADIGFAITMLGVLATRGGRLALTRVRASGREPDALQDDALNIVEVDADERVTAIVVFDLDDFEAAIAELDARYLAGEAAAHAQTWLVITGSYTAINTA